MPLISTLGRQRPDWSTKGVQDNQGLLHREILSWKKRKSGHICEGARIGICVMASQYCAFSSDMQRNALITGQSPLVRFLFSACSGASS